MSKHTSRIAAPLRQAAPAKRPSAARTTTGRSWESAREPGDVEARERPTASERGAGRETCWNMLVWGARTKQQARPRQAGVSGSRAPQQDSHRIGRISMSGPDEIDADAQRGGRVHGVRTA